MLLTLVYTIIGLTATVIAFLDAFKIMHINWFQNKKEFIQSHFMLI